jgi:hypothetical protein
MMGECWRTSSSTVQRAAGYGVRIHVSEQLLAMHDG